MEIFLTIFLVGAPTSICHFFHPSIYLFVNLSVCPSVAHHISGTVNHVINVFVKHVYNNNISRCFFLFLTLHISGTVIDMIVIYGIPL